MATAPPDVQLDQHEFFLIHPLRGQIAMSDAVLVPDVAAKWHPYTDRLQGGELVRAVDDSFAFLPFVRPRLLPELTEIAKRHGDLTNAQVPSHSIHAAALSTQTTYGHHLNTLRLTLSDSEMDHYAPVGAQINRADGSSFTVALVCDWIDVVLFPPATGFLILKLSTTNLTMSQAGEVHRGIKKVFFRDRLRVRPSEIQFRDGSQRYWVDAIPELLKTLRLSNSDVEMIKTVGASFRVFSAAIASNIIDGDTKRLILRLHKNGVR